MYKIFTIYFFYIEINFAEYLMSKKILLLLIFSLFFISCAQNKQNVQTEPQQPQQQVITPAAKPVPQQSQTMAVQPPVIPVPPPVIQLPVNDVIYVNITPFSEGKIYTITVNGTPVGVYSGKSHKIEIPKNTKLPLECRIDVPENDDKYKTTSFNIDKYTNNQTFKIPLTLKLSAASEKTIKLIVDMFNSAYQYYQTNDVTVFRNIKLGYVYYISDAFGEVPMLEPKEKMKIVDLINKNIKLPESEIAAIIQETVNLGKNFYLKKKAKNLSQDELTQIKEEITNDFTAIWWKVFDIVKKYGDNKEN